MSRPSSPTSDLKSHFMRKIGDALANPNTSGIDFKCFTLGEGPTQKLATQIIRDARESYGGENMKLFHFMDGKYFDRDGIEVTLSDVDGGDDEDDEFVCVVQHRPCPVDHAKERQTDLPDSTTTDDDDKAERKDSAAAAAVGGLPPAAAVGVGGLPPAAVAAAVGGLPHAAVAAAGSNGSGQWKMHSPMTRAILTAAAAAANRVKEDNSQPLDLSSPTKKLKIRTDDGLEVMQRDLHRLHLDMYNKAKEIYGVDKEPSLAHAKQNSLLQKMVKEKMPLRQVAGLSGGGHAHAKQSPSVAHRIVGAMSAQEEAEFEKMTMSHVYASDATNDFRCHPFSHSFRSEAVAPADDMADIDAWRLVGLLEVSYFNAPASLPKIITGLKKIVKTLHRYGLFARMQLNARADAARLLREFWVGAGLILPTGIASPDDPLLFLEWITDERQDSGEHTHCRHCPPECHNDAKESFLKMLEKAAATTKTAGDQQRRKKQQH